MESVPSRVWRISKSPKNLRTECPSTIILCGRNRAQLLLDTTLLLIESRTMLQRLLSQLVLPLLIVAVGAGGLVWLSARDKPPARVAQQVTPPVVETVPLQAEVPDFQIRVHGNVVASREVTLSAQVDGIVVTKADAIESGRHVSASTTLVQLDRRRFQLQVDKSATEIKQVDEDVRQLHLEEQGIEALTELAQREVQLAEAASTRLATLIEKNAATPAESESVERAELKARNELRLLLNQSELIPVRLERLNTQRELANHEQRLAQLNLAHSTVDAPFDGVITSVMMEQGDYVQAGDPLLTIVDMSTMDVECSLQLDDLYWLWNSVPRVPSNSQVDSSVPASRVFEVPNVGATVTCEVAGQPYHWTGRLTRYEGAGINRRTRTVLCRVRVSEPIRTQDDGGPPALMRGMHVTVTLNVQPRTELLRIPIRGVQPNDQILTVEDGLLRVHTIHPAKVLADSVLVRTDATDLTPGDRIVITSLVSPLDGIPVREIAGASDARRDDEQGNPGATP